MIVVKDIESVDAYNEGMIAHGYSVRGENDIPRRRYFVRLKEDGENHAAHIHVYEKGNPHVSDELMFRDFYRLIVIHLMHMRRLSLKPPKNSVFPPGNM